MSRPEMMCVGCGKAPGELAEYREMAEGEETTPEEFCWREEGTLNKENGHFLCTGCYVKAGCPSGPRGWIAP